MRWEELSWDKVRRAQMRWSVGCEECSVKCEVWSLECEGSSEKWEVWSVDCEVWSLECEECSVKCEVWSVKCGVLRVQCEVKCWLRRVQCEECSVKGGVWSVQCGVWRLQWEARSAKWSFKCDMWNKTPLSQSARTHGLGWRTAHASSIDEKGLIYIFKATSAPPRAGTTGNILNTIYAIMCMGRAGTTDFFPAVMQSLAIRSNRNPQDRRANARRPCPHSPDGVSGQVHAGPEMPSSCHQCENLNSCEQSLQPVGWLVLIGFADTN